MESTSVNVVNSKGKNVISRIISYLRPTKSTIVEIIALAVVILFLYTGASKLMGYSVFKEQLSESPVLKPIAPVIGWALPITEFIVAAMLFFPKYRKRGLYASLVLMTLFTGYVIAILSFSDKLPCSCGGIMEQLSWTGHIIFNTVTIGLLILALRFSRNSP